MIKLSNIKVPAAAGTDGLKATVASLLGISEQSILTLTILKRSVDARRKGDVHFVYTAVIEAENEAQLTSKTGLNITSYAPSEPYAFPFNNINAETPPVVVGMGPAGLFAALCLAKAGLKPVILERGKPVEKRTRDVGQFWKSGELNEASNVQFGEGGAGTFSDGKLTTGISDDRIAFVLRTIVDFGGPEDILYLAKPHIGTDKLQKVVSAIRTELLQLGCDIRFGHKLDGLRFSNGQLTALDVKTSDSRYTLETKHMILAPGNSARDTFEMLERDGVKLSAKNFSVGVRIEHLQNSIDTAQYGPSAKLGTLPASDYKLAVHMGNGRSVYTFCVCPGGRVIAAASEAGHLVTNGMSEYARAGRNINGALLVSVTPEDYPGSPLAGIQFQRSLEQAAYRHGGENYHAPAQRVGDFLEKRPTKKCGSVSPTHKPGVTWCNLWEVLPEFICDTLAGALPILDKSIHGFADPDAILTAVETRTSSPVRIDRTAYEAEGLSGLFPCGEGSGYAGGITSAAVDGIRAAEALCTKLTSL